MNNPKYEPLRDMEAFTEDMFNRIIAFQEKQHPAWNASLDFAERIKGLPLHYLIFSNADRDPSRSGPTVMPWYPLRKEIQKIAHYIQQVSEQPVLCDVFPGNGFVGSLIAREAEAGAKSIGLKNNIKLPNQISEFHDASVYKFTDGSPEDILEDESFDAALISWPPSASNPTTDVLKCNPKLVIYIYTDHTNEENSQRQTGCDAMLDLPEQYKLIDNWSVTRQKDLLHEVWPDMTGNPEEIRHVRIYASEPFHDIAIKQALPPAMPYDWEKDLQMAELALEAKREIEMRGFMT